MDKGILKRILSYTKPYKFYLFLAFTGAIISITFTLLGPVLIGNAIDLIIDKGFVDFKGILKILIMLSATFFLAALFQWILSLCTNKITYNTIRDIRNEAFDKIHKVPLKYIDTKSHGDIISRVVNDIDQISQGLLQGMTQLFTGVVTIIGTLIFMVFTNLTITIVVVILTPLSLFVAGFIAKRSRDLFGVQSRTQGELSGYINEIVGNQKVVTTFNYEDRAQETFEEINNRLYKSGVDSQFISSLTNPSARVVNSVVYAVVGILGAINAIHGGLTIGQISCFLTYANQYTKPFNEVSGVLAHLQTAFASAQRVFDIIDQPIEIPDEEDAIQFVNCKGDVTLENVSFSYNPEIKLLENINLQVKPGYKIAIVGPTGCGKSTIINLLMRFYDVDSGEIKVDNINIRNITRRSLRKTYGMVLQETWLFAGSIRDNIAYGKPEATLDEIISAAKASHAHSFIKRLPKGYDTIITEGGSNISQGQKQLLCIARVMLTLPPMLILDEATSSIDTRTEIRIQKAFTKLMEGRTSFVVAHRLSTIKEADVILVMKDGNIIEQGKHEQLLAQGGFYASLFNSQW
jgi:ATP-binding cassette subfamily B protein